MLNLSLKLLNLIVNVLVRSIEDWYCSRNEGKKYKYYDADKVVHYGTSIGNTIGNFLPW